MKNQMSELPIITRAPHCTLQCTTDIRTQSKDTPGVETVHSWLSLDNKPINSPQKIHGAL